MDRDEFGWMIIRAFGIFFAYLVVSFSISLVSQVSIVLSMYAHSEPPSDLTQAVWFRISVSAVQLLLYALASYYCFWRGAWIHKILVHGIGGRRKP